MSGLVPDTSADLLRVAFSGPVLPAVAIWPARLLDADVEVAVLAASHQIRTGEVALETLACTDGGAVPGPCTASVPAGADRWTLTFDFAVRPTSPPAMRALVARLRDTALVHTFPGHPLAVTAVEVAPDGWSTWHCYPEHGHVARTRTVAVRARQPAPLIGATLVGASAGTSGRGGL
jgi:hypothetical protein